MITLKKIIKIIIERVLDSKAYYYLKKVHKKESNCNKRMSVGFIVFEPETWDKLAPIYDYFKTQPKILTTIVVVPSFDQKLRITKEYGGELGFFKSIDKDIILGYSKEKPIKYKNLAFDYVFYQDPYNHHIPKVLNSNTAVKYSKVCYIPYGYSGSNVFQPGNTNNSFFRNVSFCFDVVREDNDLFLSKYNKNIKNGFQHFFMLGYPALEKCIMKKDSPKCVNRILWTPRWSYDERIGGSHFFEYYNTIVSIKKRYPHIDIVMRPHPMMFSNFVREGRITKEDVEFYKKNLENNGITISNNPNINSDIKETDLLITDYSSIIPMFIMNNIKVVYCSSCIALNEDYKEIGRAFYSVDDSKSLFLMVEKLIHGEDQLLKDRRVLIKKMAQMHDGASLRIVQTLINDYFGNQ